VLKCIGRTGRVTSHKTDFGVVMNQRLDLQYYEILGVSPSASAEEIETAYKKACEIYSPANPEFSTSFQPEEAAELRGWVEEAYLEICKKLKSQNAFIEKHIVEQPTKELYQFEKEELMEKELVPEFEHELYASSFYDGLILKKLRLKKNISLNFISNKTCIGVHHLIAIEANDFDSLPAAVFVRSYVKQIAQILGLNSKEVSDSYMRLYQDAHEA
jgi:curved DNA-binding protein CbpA